MLRGGVVSERVREQGLSAMECDIPDRWSIAEYRRALAIAATTGPERPSLFRRLLAPRR
jgi:hypothetical protein